MDNILFINGSNLNLENSKKFLTKSFNKIEIEESAKVKVQKSYQTVKNIIQSKKIVYGITTGFGSFADVFIDEKDTKELQKNLIISHAAGVGKPFSTDIVRLIMLYRANALSKGYSGICPDTLQLLIEMINRDIIPIVPEYGSVGASGDLAPLSHIALAMIGLGEVFYKGKRIPAIEAFNSENLKPVELQAKEGLALNNGTQMMAAVGIYALSKFENLIKTAILAATLSVEGLMGTSTPFRPEIHNIRPHYGQKKIAEIIYDFLKDSEIVNSHKDCKKVQDAYTLRCIPQVYGACLDVFKHVKNIMEIEINSATDNPLIFDEDNVLSGGNFHGEPLALNLDYLALAVSEIASMSERRIDRMLNNGSNKLLPPFLTQNGGLNSGLMIAHYTAAALVSENKVLSHPASVDSIPTSANQEDHVSMGSIGAIKILKILENLENVLCIELLCGSNAVDFHKPLKCSSETTKLMNVIREDIDFWDKDRIMYTEIDKMKKIINSEKYFKIIKNINL